MCYRKADEELEDLLFIDADQNWSGQQTTLDNMTPFLLMKAWSISQQIITQL